MVFCGYVELVPQRRCRHVGAWMVEQRRGSGFGGMQ